MERQKALTILYNSALEPFLKQEEIEFTKGVCPQLSNQKVIWIANYDKSFYQFIFENDLIPIANFKAYYFDTVLWVDEEGIERETEEQVISVNENNYTEHLAYVSQFEKTILTEWLPKEE